MTRFLLFFLIYFSSPLALAQDMKKDNYVEIGLGLVIISDPSTEPLTGTSPNGDITYNNLRLNLESENATAWSFEYGRHIDRNFGLRTGVNYSSFKGKIKRIYGTGSYTYNGTTYNVSNSLNRSEVPNAASYDTSINILSANLYKDFDQADSNFTPYIGLGLGQADINNTSGKENVSSLTVGFNYDIYDSTYIGGKFLYNKVSGPTNNDGLKYEDINLKTWSLQIGRRF